MGQPVFFDDKSVQMFVTPDKWVHRFYPGITPDAVPSKAFYHDQAKAKLIGNAGEIPKGSHVLYYQPFTTAENEFLPSGAERIIYWLEPVAKVLKPILGSKFPQITLDKHTNYIHMHYWANLPPGEAYVGLQPVEGLEPYNELTGTVTEYHRIMCFARGQFYACWVSTSGGAAVFQPTFIFDAPQIVNVPPLWNPANAAEPVLDIHPYKEIFYFNRFTQTKQSPDGGEVYESTPQYKKPGCVREVRDYGEKKFSTAPQYQHQLWIEFDRPVKYPRVLVLPSYSGLQDCVWKDIDPCAGGNAPGDFSFELKFAMIKTPLAPGSEWGLDKLTWHNAYHQTDHMAVGPSEFFQDASRFVDFIGAEDLFGGVMHWEETYTPPQTKWEGRMTHTFRHNSIVFMFHDGGIIDLSDDTFYGICVFWNVPNWGGHYLDPTSALVGEGTYGNLSIFLDGYPKGPPWDFLNYNAFGMRNNWGITKEDVV